MITSAFPSRPPIPLSIWLALLSIFPNAALWIKLVNPIILWGWAEIGVLPICS